MSKGPSSLRLHAHGMGLPVRAGVGDRVPLNQQAQVPVNVTC